jgi:hypothetical protein
MKPDRIIVERILRIYNPFQPIFNEGFCYCPAPEDFDDVDPVPPPTRTDLRLRVRTSMNEEMGRVRFFRELALQGRALAPIELDNMWSGCTPYALAMIDGHHRACGAALAGSDTIRCNYSGDVSVLRWLQGEGNADDLPF